MQASASAKCLYAEGSDEYAVDVDVLSGIGLLFVVCIFWDETNLLAVRDDPLERGALRGDPHRADIARAGVDLGAQCHERTRL